GETSGGEPRSSQVRSTSSAPRLTTPTMRATSPTVARGEEPRTTRSRTARVERARPALGRCVDAAPGRRVAVVHSAAHHRGNPVGRGLDRGARTKVEVKGPPSPVVLTGSTAVLVQRTITLTVFVIAGLSFAFGFGNGYLLGLQLGVSGFIAPLIAPSVDLSVVTLLATIHFLRAHGVGGRLTSARVLLIGCGLITFALNTARPILAHAVGKACFDAVAPCLLIGWSEVGPKLLMLLHGIVPDETGLPAELVTSAQKLDADHRNTTGRQITRDKLRAQLKISNAVASELIRII